MGFQGDMAELVDATDLNHNFEPFLKNQKSESSQIQRNACRQSRNWGFALNRNPEPIQSIIERSLKGAETRRELSKKGGSVPELFKLFFDKDRVRSPKVSENLLVL